MNQRFLPIICLSILTACAGNSVKDSESIQQSAIQQAKAIDQDPQSVIAESQNLQIEAQKEDLYFFSPTYMKQAEDALEDAEDAIKSKKQPHEIIAYALTAQKLFKRGLENKPTVLKQLKASFDGIEMLRDIETDKVLTSDFQDVQDDTKDLIVLIEQGKTTEAISEQKDLLNDIAEIEIKTLKKIYLTVAENALDKAEDADAEDFAAKSFDKAQKMLETFERFIETSANQRESIKAKSKLALQLAQHAENVAKAAQPLLKLTPETAEDHILFIEKLMGRIATALNQTGILSLNLNSQSIAIAQAAETASKRAATQSQVAEQPSLWKIEKAKLIATIESLKQPQAIKTEILAPDSGETTAPAIEVASAAETLTASIEASDEETSKSLEAESVTTAQESAVSLTATEEENTEQGTKSKQTNEEPIDTSKTPETLKTVSVEASPEIAPTLDAVADESASKEVTTETSIANETPIN